MDWCVGEWVGVKVGVKEKRGWMSGRVGEWADHGRVVVGGRVGARGRSGWAGGWIIVWVSR